VSELILVYGLGGTAPLKSGDDLNSVDQTGLYRITTGTANNTYGNGSVLVVNRGSGVVDQLILSVTDSKLYLRNTANNGSLWTVIVSIGGYALPANYHDIRINYTDANTITLLAGSRVRSSDDTTDIIFASDRTCVLNASGENGLDTGSEAVSTWYHLYAIYNPTTLTSALVFSTVNEAVSGSITLPSGFTKKRQLKFSVRNDGSSNIIPFTFLQNGKILYRAKSGDGGSGWSSVTLTLGNGLTSTTYADVSCSGLIPPTSRLGIITGYSNAGDVLFLKQKGSPSTDEVAVAQVGSNGVAVSFYGMEVATDASQAIQYKKSAGIGNIGLGCAGYIVTEVL